METPKVPGPGEVLQSIKPLLLLLWEALEVGLAAARAHFGDQPVEGSLGSHLARFHAKGHLKNNGLPCASIANDGIEFEWEGCTFRVMHSDEGALPVAGSERKIIFYCQKQLELSFMAPPGASGDVEHDASLPGINYVVLWDAYPRTYTGLVLTLACPKSGGKTRAEVDAHWYALIPHPAELIGDANPPQVGDEDDDLDIGRLGNEGSGQDDGQ